MAAREGKDKGVTFAVELPTVPAPVPAQPDDRSSRGGAVAEHVATEATAQPTTTPPTTTKKRILLVDDHEDTARAMARLLQRLGHQVLTATTMAEAIEQYDRSGGLDLLISDIGLPDGSGLDLIRALRARCGNGTPVRGIALSGFGMEEDVRKSKEAGFYEHLTKPINFQKLQAVIRDATGGNS